MAFFYSFTDSLRQKWLQFFQVNRDWIKLHMQVESVYTPDGGKRPPSYLILGVANALEPKLAQLMLPFSKLNPDADTLIEVLGLNFDPDVELGNSVIAKPENFQDEDESEQDHNETLTIPQSNGLENGAIAHDLEMSYVHEETFMVSDTMLRDEMRAVAAETLNGEQEQNVTHKSEDVPQVDAVDEFGDISFDDLKETDNTISASAKLDENEFSEVLSDVWGNETAESSTDFFIGEEQSDNTFDDSDIASLFPNG